MTEDKYPAKVFVYGTLKRGGSNHDVMVRAGGKFLCEAKSVELRKLIVTHLPFLCDGHAPNGYQVEGEIFEIPDEHGLDKIDTLEGNGSFYQRRLDYFIELDAPNEHTAWVYYIIREMDGEPRKSF
ncbi:MAG TPA: hypothetical protein DCG39_07905 [Opitutae bacterium]|nr:hypothetical protein [Opitutae bacterium]|tara:strand:+ start:1839 stop:2216 length:378 start_codon:yes stop_codon:yes gene_type:complete